MIRTLHLWWLRFWLSVMPKPEVFEDFPSKEDYFKGDRDRMLAEIERLLVADPADHHPDRKL